MTADKNENRWLFAAAIMFLILLCFGVHPDITASGLIFSLVGGMVG